MARLLKYLFYQNSGFAAAACANGHPRWRAAWAVLVLAPLIALSACAGSGQAIPDFPEFEGGERYIEGQRRNRDTQQAYQQVRARRAAQARAARIRANLEIWREIGVQPPAAWEPRSDHSGQ